jgi:hypothetical protein
MLVVVGRVGRVAMVTVDVVDVIVVGHRHVTAILSVHMHVAGVRKVRRGRRAGHIVTVVAVAVGETAVVDAVHMRVPIVRLVRHRRLGDSSPVWIDTRPPGRIDMRSL